MALKTRVEPINRDIELMLREELSPAAQSKQFAIYAREAIDEAKETNRTILGRIPRHTVSVDGNMGAALESVRPDGYINAEFELLDDVLAWFGEQLVINSPVGEASEGDPHPGLYQKSHTLYADANEVPLGGRIPPAEEYVFINTQPYARVIETGSSSQAPDGVYQALATLGRGRFGNIAKISFTYRGVVGIKQIKPPGQGVQRNNRGQFTGVPGGAAHNVSDDRFPAIIVRPN